MRAENQIIHHLKDKVGLVGADRLVARLKAETRVEATPALPSRWGCAHGPGGDRPFCAELEVHDEGDCPTVRVHPDDAEQFAAMVDRIHQLETRPTRAEVLREAAEAAVRAARGCGDSETGQYAASVVACVARKLRRMADVAVAGEDR